MFTVDKFDVRFWEGATGPIFAELTLSSDKGGSEWEKGERETARESLVKQLVAVKAAWNVSPLAVRAERLVGDLALSEKQLAAARSQVAHLESVITNALSDDTDPATFEASLADALGRVTTLDHRVKVLARLSREAKDAALAALHADLNSAKQRLSGAASEACQAALRGLGQAVDVFIEGGLYAAMCDCDQFRPRRESGVGAGSAADELVEVLMAEASTIGVPEPWLVRRPAPAPAAYRGSDYGPGGNQAL